MSHCFRLTAPRSMGNIPKGYQLQVPSNSCGSPARNDVEKALRAAGFTDTPSLSYASSGNWTVEEM